MGCGGCDHVFQHPPTVTASYDFQYIARYFDRPEREMSCLRVGFLKAFCARGKLLDVGYGTGAFVEAALAAGFDAYGYDIHGIERAVREKPLISAETWDVVTFFDSLEHFADLAPVRDVCSRAQWVIVSLPRMPLEFPSDRDWRHYRPGEHLQYFTEKSLKTLFWPKQCVLASNVEDTLRGALERQQNILTMVFNQSDRNDESRREVRGASTDDGDA
jgi:SAM-dependent methyltransferase